MRFEMHEEFWKSFRSYAYAQMEILFWIGKTWFDLQSITQETHGRIILLLLCGIVILLLNSDQLLY